MSLTLKIKKVANEIKKETSFIISKQTSRKILFDHLPKCGGSSINQFLERNFLRRNTYNIKVVNQDYFIKRFINLPEKKRYRFDLIKGHLTHSLIDYVHPETLKITIFRDPVERIISHYYYSKNNADHYLYHAINSKKMSLEDYVNSGISNELKNWYVTHFLGRSIDDGDKLSINHAVNEVLNNYDIVGFLDEIEVFTKEVYHRANLKYPFMGEKINESKRPENNEILEKVKKMIRDINCLDVEFYKELRKRIK